MYRVMRVKMATKIGFRSRKRPEVGMRPGFITLHVIRFMAGSEEACIVLGFMLIGVRYIGVMWMEESEIYCTEACFNMRQSAHAFTPTIP